MVVRRVARERSTCRTVNPVLREPCGTVQSGGMLRGCVGGGAGVAGAHNPSVGHAMPNVAGTNQVLQGAVLTVTGNPASEE